MWGRATIGRVKKLAFVLLAAAVVAGAVPAGAAGSVERAQQEVEASREEVDSAARSLVGAVQDREARAVALVAAAAALRAATLRIEHLTFEAASTRLQIEAAESALRELGSRSRARTIVAYMAGGTGMLDVFFEARTLEQVVTGNRLADAANRIDEDEALRVDLARIDLEGLRARLAQAEDRLSEWRWQADQAVGRASLLLDQAAVQVTNAKTDLERADADYRAAVAMLEGAIAARSAIGPSVERWRPLVEGYFPPALVDDALSVLRCESWGDPHATNPYSGAAGLFQFMPGTWAWVARQVGFGDVDPYDPEANVAAAAWLVAYSIRTDNPRGTWGRWTCQP